MLLETHSQVEICALGIGKGVELNGLGGVVLDLYSREIDAGEVFQTTRLYVIGQTSAIFSGILNSGSLQEG
jgi:hypothetical protein